MRDPARAHATYPVPERESERERGPAQVAAPDPGWAASVQVLPAPVLVSRDLLAWPELSSRSRCARSTPGDWLSLLRSPAVVQARLRR